MVKSRLARKSGAALPKLCKKQNRLSFLIRRGQSKTWRRAVSPKAKPCVLRGATILM